MIDHLHALLLPPYAWWVLTVLSVWAVVRIADRCGWLPPSDD